MNIIEQAKKFIADAEWDKLSDFLEKQTEKVEHLVNSSHLMEEEKRAQVNKQLADIEWLAHSMSEQKKEVEQQLLSLKHKRAVSKRYLSDDK